MKTKDLEYYRLNADENYITTPISVLRYITELETTNAKLVEELKQAKSLAPEVWWRMDEQVKMINQLQSELSAAKESVRELEESKWISVNDRLPEIDINVLCLTDMGEMCVTSFSGKYDKPKLKKGVIWNDPTGYYSPTGDVDYYTHWMELPKK